ncbi:MAG TPA: amino acid adenylation domain-containing protein, partial [Thermoanaerobaculia bacterium]|nr:amino acid adenylation domain-containing protein [Thermoanaerobaculia bacterium]
RSSDLVLLAGFQLLLSRYSRQEDVSTGTPTAGRDREELEGLIGFFASMLVLRTDLSGDPPFRGLLARVRETALSAFEHQEIPFEKLVDALQLPRDPSHTPLFQVEFVLQNTPEPSLQAQDLTLEPLSAERETAKFDLLLEMFESPAGLFGVLEHNRDLFDRSTAARLTRGFERLLAAIADAPDTPVSRLPLLPEAERHQVLAEWNDTAHPWSGFRTLHGMFEDRVREQPEAPAAVFEDESLTYRELSARANQLAHHLRRLGVGPDVRVAVSLERSLDLVTTLLGVLKAGGAYVPIDPDYPADRRAFMLEDSRAAVLVTDLHGITGESTADPEGGATAESLAYVIYTSGSTGRPKGAMVHHRGIHNRLLWMQAAYRLTPADTVLQKTPFSFDVSVWEFFWPLLAGARLVLARPGGHRDGAYLADLIGRERVTVMHFVPSMLQAFLEEPDLSACGSLRLVVASGEALPPELVARFARRLPGADLQNLYGPTEASVDVTSWGCRPVENPTVIPIGRPIANTRIHLVDPALEPVPIGVPGELWIGGVNVGRGYLGRPDLTAERFGPDPFGEPGARLYRTGDLARLRTDGEIEYLGRVDFQVKVRGFRIELGEIESSLVRHPEVREAAVLVRDDAGGQLVAYVVPQGSAAPGAEELRSFLAERLPGYMVPAFFVPLAALPLTPNGKLDRRALPAPERTAATGVFTAPRTPAEKAVAGIWEELLKAERVGLADNFFDLGGDSIKAVRLVSRVNEQLEADLRVQDVFKHQTVASLVERIAARTGTSLADDHATGLAEIERFQRAVLADPRQRAKLPEGYEDFFPLSGIEKGMVYYTLLLPEQPIYHDQHAYVLSIPDLDRFYHAVGLLTGRHPILRSTFHLDAFEEPVKVVHRELAIEREVEDLSGLPPAEQKERVEAYRAADLRHRFTFQGERLWRLRLFRLAGELHATVWTWHHAILDGWSNLTFWLELNELLAREDVDRLSSVPPLANTYKDYLAISLARRRSPATEAYWRATLAGASRNKLPFNRAATRERSAFGMRSLFRPLRLEVLFGLRERAAELHVPVQALFLAAHLHLLSVTSGEEDVVTGVVSHDRPGIPDGDRIVGCFLNTFPLRLRLQPGESGASLARRVARYLAEEKEHEIPLVDVAGLVGARESAQNPIFDTLLNFMDFHLMEEVRDNVLFQSMAGRAAERELPELRSDEMTNTLFDLEVMATPAQPFLRLKYLPRHFEAADVERALALYDRILEALHRDPEAPLGTEALLSDEERGQLVHAYNGTARAYPRERPLHGFFEERAALHPERLAVVAGERSLTYGEIERQANRLARHLLAQGVRPGDNVGVCFERTPELVVALFGVLKAGGAYVPMEPSYPAARKEYIVRQSAVSLVLEELPGDLDGYADTPVPVRPWPDSLAYTIYTSGSTGTPKGVMIEHHSAANLVEWVNREFEVGPDTRVLMLSSVCFDLSVYDVFGALGAGASVAIARQEEIQDPAALKELATRVTFWNSVPSTLGLLVQYLEETDPDFRGEDLRLAFLSGDWIPLSLPERAKRFFPNLRVISLGGATEATVWSIFHPVERIDEAWLSIPYGRPLDNNTFYVLDRHLELVPPGVVGDLYIGGVGVARGYAGDPEKTAASYRPDPFSGSGQRLYRTGDLGRMLPEGEIEFLGRSDNQVKVRGFRIELGEIESQLSRAPGVREAVVLARTDRAGQKYLCGYVVATDEVSIAALQDHLAGSLPGYMIPDTFVFLSELPLTANGKIDRKALPEPETAYTAAEPAEGPRSETEAALLEIWEEVLGLSGLGTTQDFFALGGHSLSAIQVLTRVRRRFEVDLPLPDLFENPTVSGLAAVLDGLRETGAAAPPLRRFERPERPERLPLSFAQERLWFLDRLQPDSPFYNLPMALEMRGALSVPALAASLGEVVRRHEGLRTRFPLAAGSPVQEIAPALDVAPPLVDLSGLSAAAQEAEAAWLTQALAVQPFDLAAGPLLRSALLRLDPERHVVLFSIHHIVTDGWSMALLMQEVAELYRAATAGEPSPLPELPVQYADFALWQRAWLTGAALEEQTGWWHQSLAGAPHVLDLPTDRPRPAVQSLRGAHVFALLPVDLEALSREHGATPFMTWLALFGALLHRYTGVEDLLVGSPIAGRNHAELERLIGLFVNTLVLRVEMQGDPTLAEVLGRVRERTVGAYAHQDLPFEKLVEELHPERSLAHTPLFQVMLVQQNAPVGAVEIPGLTFLPRPAESGTARFDLHLALTDTPSGPVADLEYNRDLFDPPAMARLLGHLRLLAEGAVRDPRARLSELPLLSTAESHQLRLGWNDTAADRQPGLTLPGLFAEQVARTPDAPAVTFEGRTLSYRKLDLLSGRLAARLLKLGAGPDTAVGVLMERSAEMVVALLGVLKAGAAYLPLDPEYPAERLGWILEDARVPVVLAQERLLGSLELAETRVLCLEEGWKGKGAPAMGTGLSEQSLAYVLYTSGSTGRPKGVMIPHRGIVNRLLWMQEAYGLTADDRVLQKTPYSFDVSVWEFFWPLLTGAHLVVAKPGGHRDGAYLAGLIESERVTVMHFVPSMLQAFLEEPDLSGCASLRLVVASGEALSPELRRRFRERLSARLENLYGPTEASVDVTSWNCATEARGGIVPIGRPVANTCIHLLDRAFSPVPIGIPGELCIGGVQLARGYWRRPDLTAERFVPGEAGERLYRTGDLARHLPDGAVEYLGRLDFQVKVRGFRIELGEIESMLAGHPGVRETVVVARDGRLVAYVTLQAGAAADTSELRSFLASRVPEYMTPPSWVALDELPLTPSGKVDRRALPAPEAAGERGYVAPKSFLEQVVAGIWAELLKVERVGLADNFFDLGGDSIKAVRLVSRINERLGADLRVQDVFKHQTVGPLAERIAIRSDRSQADELAAGRAEIERLQGAVLADPRQRARLPEGSEDFFPLSGIEKGMIYYTLLLPEQPVYHDQHAYGLSIPGLDRFYRALALVMGRHPILRSTFHLDEFQEPMKVVHRSVPVVRDVEDLSGLPAAEQRERIEEYRAADLRHKFTFRGEILWRLKLFRLEGDSFITVWTWHHAILDGWSNLTFWIDLNELLAREDLDRIESVAPLASSYKDYLAISLGRRRSPATETFWRATLAGASRNKLPFNRAATRERGAFGMRSLYRPLSREALLGLRERAAELSVPLQALFLAAHLHLLRVTSGEEDVITGVVSHDRPGIPDGDRIVGCFLNTFPIRLRLEPGESGAALARRVARFLAVEKEHEIPLVDVAGLVGARESAQNPIFDTLLNFMDFHLMEDVQENVLFRPAAGSGELPDLRSDEMTNTLFDLEVSAALVNPFLRLKYLPRHFEAADVERALALYDRILEGLRRDPNAPLGTETLLSEEERGELVHVYNDTARAYPRERPLHGFFEEQAARAPERLAVVVGDRSLTYGEIERQANRLARHLAAQGVRPGDNVGVCLERTPELVVALFGVLKAGAAYVPMEPSYPAARKEYIVRQSAVSLVLEELPGDLDGYADTPVPVRPGPDSLAYTIYTSGSTGTPKGVMIEHHSAANLIEWVNREFEVGPDTRVLMLSSVCFDLSVYDVFGALGAGASVVIARQEEIQDPAALLRLVVEQKVTFWNSVPSTLGLLVQYLEETAPDFRGEDLQIAFLSGDWIPLSLPERAQRFFPGLRVISLGGATEGTVWSIFHPVQGIDEAWASIPYGKPLDNNTFYVLDHHQELVPPGVVGDLYIGGVGVARGYAGDPEKTAASYRPDPFSGSGQRLYRTGDLGRMLPEGEIEFLGRSDNQVKVRGFRIELGEIEAVLTEHSAVRNAVVHTFQRQG